MFGPDDWDGDSSTWGVIPRMVKTVYNKIDSNPESTYKVFVSVCEIQREIISDLLVQKTNLPIKQKGTGKKGLNFDIVGLSQHECKNAGHVLKAITVGSSNRAVAKTEYNDRSSRGHCIVKIKIQSENTYTK